MKKRRINWILFMILASALFFGCGRKPGDRLYHEALAEWNEGNLVRARALLEKSIRRRAGSTENAEAYNRLGVLLWEMGNPKEAAEAFNESCRLHAGRYEVLCNLGIALSAQNDFQAAEQAFREAALIQPEDPRPLAFAGTLYAANRRWDDAVRNLNLALARAPEDPALQTALALVELETAGADPALKRLQAVVKRYPDYAPAVFNTAAVYYYRLKNPAEAKRWFERYLAKVPGGALADQTRTELEIIEGTAAREKIAFRPPAKTNRVHADQNFRKALAYHKKNDLDNAARWYIKAVEEDDTYEQAFYNLGLTYYAANRLELAADAFARAVQINPSFTSARYNSALAEYRLGNTGRASRELEIILKEQPGYQPAQELAGRIRKGL